MTYTALELDHQLERATEAEVDADVEAMVARAVTAQETFENWTDLRVDALLHELANAFADQAEELAMATVAETGLGNVEDKAIKNRFASLTVFESIAGKITQGFYAGEKLAPWLSFFSASGEDQGLRLYRLILRTAGAGHTAIIHTTSRARMERFARAMPAGRILINAPGAQGCCA